MQANEKTQTNETADPFVLIDPPLDNYVMIYIPNTYDIDKELDQDLREEHIEIFQAFFSSAFGGYSMFSGRGGWYSSELQRHICEDILYIKAFCTSESLKKYKQELYNNILHMKKELQQEAISVEINNKLYFV